MVANVHELSLRFSLYHAFVAAQSQTFPFTNESNYLFNFWVLPSREYSIIHSVRNPDALAAEHVEQIWTGRYSQLLLILYYFRTTNI